MKVSNLSPILLKKRRNREDMKEQYLTKRREVLLRYLRTEKSDRMSYIEAQYNYFTYFAYSYESKQDTILYNYRRKLQREMQWVIISNLHVPLLCSTVLYYITRHIKSGHLSAITSSAWLSLFLIYSMHLTSWRYPFELAYPAHPLILDKRKETIDQWSYFDPKIIKYELEYLNKFVYKDGYTKSFRSSPKNVEILSI